MEFPTTNTLLFSIAVAQISSFYIHQHMKKPRIRLISLRSSREATVLQSAGELPLLPVYMAGKAAGARAATV